jgi:hypothetical protein
MLSLNIAMCVAFHYDTKLISARNHWGRRATCLILSLSLSLSPIRRPAIHTRTISPRNCHRSHTKRQLSKDCMLHTYHSTRSYINDSIFGLSCCSVYIEHNWLLIIIIIDHPQGTKAIRRERDALLMVVEMVFSSSGRYLLGVSVLLPIEI